MDVSRSLPPLINGKTRGVLDFFIDEIIIFRDLFFLSNCDVMAQVQWWGEVVPALIRPPSIQLGDKFHKYDSANAFYYHSVRYEIRTTTELLKLYLRTCEVLELAILETVETYVIGSAFLKDILYLINNSEIITSPIVNYEGEKIGEVKIHFKFSANENDVKVKENILTAKTLDCSDLNNQSSNVYNVLDCRYLVFKEKAGGPLPSRVFYKQILNESDTLDLMKNKQCFPSTNPIIEKLDKEHKIVANLAYDAMDDFQAFDEYQNFNFLQTIKTKGSISEPKTLKQLDQSVDPYYNMLESKHVKNFSNCKDFDFFHNYQFTNTFQHSEINETKKNPATPSNSPKDCKVSVPAKETCNEKEKKILACLPEVKLYKDSSKVLHFKIPRKELKSKGTKLIKKESAVSKKKKVVNKPNLLKKHNVSKFDKNIRSKENKTHVKKTVTGKNTSVQVNTFSEANIPHLNLKSLNDENSKINIENDSLKKNNDKVVLDYLLGSDMSRNDEESALNQIKQMSPSHPLISAVSELQSDTTPVSKLSSTKNSGPLFVKVNNLNFNLKNPIEKTYYEKFFSKSKPFNSDFEVAEFLNRPVRSNLKDSSSSSSYLAKKADSNFNDKHNVDNGKCFLSANLKMRNACAKCSYYKKIDELDVIIESLKHFEKQMLSKEKNEQLSEIKKKFLDVNLGPKSNR